jgi:hypothetical protein
MWYHIPCGECGDKTLHQSSEIRGSLTGIFRANVV